jgi:pimeloyl-ACP methyl ester carboxylesterase
MRIEVSSGIEVEYETFGDSADPPVLLVMGFGTQLLGWDADSCRMLAAAGHRVIRYDNRDCGLSTKFDGSPLDLGDVVGALAAGEVERAQTTAPYTLRDMAADGVGLLDGLEIERAHIVGSSMGGMIAQKIAIESPERVLSLTSMSSSTGEPDYGKPTKAAQEVLLSPRPVDRASYIAAAERDLV